MRTLSSSRPVLGLGLLALLVFSGCDNTGGGATSGGSSSETLVVGDSTPDPVPPPAVTGGGGEEPSLEPGDVPPDDVPTAHVPAADMPGVLMSHADDETCLVKLHDEFPTAELADTDDQPRVLSELYGDKLSIVCFWTLRDVESARQQNRARSTLEDLKYDVAEKFEDFGLHVVAVNVGNSADDVRRQAEDADLNYPMLHDSDGTLFGQVATARLPRVYLLDAEGKVLWCDIEVSRSTRRDLIQASHHSLGQQ